MAVTQVEAQSVVERAALQESLEKTRAAFHQLVAEVGDARWREKSPRSAWTLGEVLEHLTWALEQLPKEVAMARQGRGMFNFPKWIADPGSYWITRWQARKCDARSILLRYDAAMDAAIRTLATVPDSDWNLGAPFYGHGFHSVARLFEVPAEHLREHTGNGARPTGSGTLNQEWERAQSDGHQDNCQVRWCWPRFRSSVGLSIASVDGRARHAIRGGSCV